MSLSAGSRKRKRRRRWKSPPLLSTGRSGRERSRAQGGPPGSTCGCWGQRTRARGDEGTAQQGPRDCRRIACAAGRQRSRVVAYADVRAYRLHHAFPSSEFDLALRAPSASVLVLYTAMKVQRGTKLDLADRLGVRESAVRKLANPDHRSHISQIQRALRAVGHSLKVEVTAA